MLITDRQSFDAMLRAIETSETIAWDTEANGLYPRHGNKTIALSVYTPSNDTAYYFAFDHGTSDTAKQTKALKIYQDHIQAEVMAENMPIEWLDDLKAVWTKPRLLIAHNAPFDLTALDLLGFPTPERIADTMAMLAVIHSDWRGSPDKGIVPKYLMPDTGKYETGSRGLKWQSRLWGLDKASSGIDGLTEAYNALQAQINEIAGKSTRLTAKKKEVAQEFLWALKPSDVAHYACEDARLTYKLYEKILKYGEKWDDQAVFDLYNEMTLAAWYMTKHGMRLDVDGAAALIRKVNTEVETLTSDVKQLTGGIIEKINSTDQVREYLYSIGVEAAKADKATLAPLEHLPAIKKILRARAISKRVGTFIGVWHRNHVNGFLHFSYNIGATSTGRASSSDKKFNNAQNLPRSSEKVAVNPKEFILPPKGYILVEFDYSGMEMTLAAFIAENVLKLDPHYTLTRIIESGADIHGRTMEMSGLYDMILEGKSEADWLIENGYKMKPNADPAAYFRKEIARQRAKTGGFAVLYGGGIGGVARGVKCTDDQAKAIIRGFHKAYPAMRPALEYFEELAQTPRALPNDTKSMGSYIKYPLPGLQLKRKYHFYPTKATSKDGGVWSPLKRMARGAFNSEIQGTGAMILYKSIVRIMRELGFSDYRLTESGDRVYDRGMGRIVPMGTVHDSLILAFRPEDLHLVRDVYRIMTDFTTRPKLQVDVSAALVDGSWSSVQHIGDLDKWIESKGTVR